MKTMSTFFFDDEQQIIMSSFSCHAVNLEQNDFQMSFHASPKQLRQIANLLLGAANDIEGNNATDQIMGITPRPDSYFKPEPVDEEALRLSVLSRPDQFSTDENP